MKSSTIVCALAAALALGSFPAFSQGQVRDRNASNNPEIYQQTHPEDQSGRNLQGPGYGQDRRNFDRRESQLRREDERRRVFEQRREYEQRRNHDRRDYGRRDFNDRGQYYYGARSPEFRRGGYIPREYRNHQYYVNDWRSHRLAPPPYGHQWVQVGSDYVLIALATGLIANLILNQ